MRALAFSDWVDVVNKHSTCSAAVKTEFLSFQLTLINKLILLSYEISKFLSICYNSFAFKATLSWALPSLYFNLFFFLAWVSAFQTRLLWILPFSLLTSDNSCMTMYYCWYRQFHCLKSTDFGIIQGPTFLWINNLSIHDGESPLYLQYCLMKDPPKN